MIHNMTPHRFHKSAGLIRLFALVLAIAANGGCATIIKGSHQAVPISSEPTSADVLLDGTLVGQTPMSIQMKRKHDHLVTVQKAGFHPSSVAVVRDVGGAVWGNIIAGGLIGWGVDATTGAQYNLFPVTISLRLDPVSVWGAEKSSDDQAIFVTKLEQLDRLHDGKKMSDEEYAKARLELFRRYMPQALAPEIVKNLTRSNASFGVESTELAVTSFGREGVNGAMVKAVATHSVAEGAGIQVGDILLRIGDVSINGPADVQAAAAIGVASAGAIVPIKLMRKSSSVWVNAQF
jgi:hypothetical protein